LDAWWGAVMVPLLTLILILHGILALRQVHFIQAQSQSKATRYAITRTWIVFLSFALDIFYVLFWVMSGLLQNIPNPIVLFSSLILCRMIMRSLILGFLQRAVEQQFGLNKAAFTLFITDLFKSFVLQACIVISLVSVMVYLLPADPLWQITGIWVIWFGLEIFIMIFKPMIHTSLFQHARQIETSSLQNRLQQLANRTGLKTLELLVLDGSLRSSHANARMEGIGPLKRIVMLDTLVELLNEEEIEAVVAHELGHQQQGHILKYLQLKGALAFIGIWVFYFFMGNQITYLILLAPSVASLALPILNSFKKRCEFQADGFAARQTDAYILSQALDKIHQNNNAFDRSDPIYSLFYQGHPTGEIRKRKLINGTAKTHMA
jgi:STE24 endopeptidase